MPPKTTRYSTVSHADTYDDDSSATEVDEAFAGGEKQWHQIDLDTDHKSSQGHAWKRLKGALRRYRWLIDTLLLLTNIGLSLGLSLLLYYQFEDFRFPSSTRQVGGDYTGAGPQCELRETHGGSGKTQERSWLTRGLS